MDKKRSFETDIHCKTVDVQAQNLTANAKVSNHHTAGKK